MTKMLNTQSLKWLREQRAKCRTSPEAAKMKREFRCKRNLILKSRRGAN